MGEDDLNQFLSVRMVSKCCLLRWWLVLFIEAPVLVGFQVSAKPSRFEHWGACEDIPLPNHALSLTVISKPSSTNPQHKRHEVYTGLGHRCGVIPYSSVVVVDCLLG